MSYKIWIASGILLMLTGIFGTIWGMYKSFDPLLTDIAPALDEVGNGLGIALFCNVLFFVGIIPFVIGVVIFVKKNKSKI